MRQTSTSLGAANNTFNPNSRHPNVMTCLCSTGHWMKAKEIWQACAIGRTTVDRQLQQLLLAGLIQRKPGGRHPRYRRVRETPSTER